MSCGNDSKTDNNINRDWQDLSGWKNTSLTELSDRLKGLLTENVRIYTVKSTRLVKESNEIQHLGSGPNLEGGIATLCTCKRSMRQDFPGCWEGEWVLGLTSRARDKGFSGSHHPLYMMKVEKAFDSHKDLYNHLKSINERSLAIKNASNNPRGDIFEPKDSCKDPLDPKNYKPPHKKHSHRYSEDNEWHPDDEWHDDIEYVPLLLGDKNNTFVWSKPTIVFNKNRGSGSMILSMADVFKLLI